MAAFAGRYYDGETAKEHAVSVVLGARELEIRAEKVLVTTWPYGELRLVDRPARGRPLRLTVESRRGARLSVPQSGFLTALQTRAPDLSRRTPPGRGRWRSTIVGSGLIAALVVLFAVVVPAVSTSLVPLLPERWVRSLGAAAVSSITERMPACDGAEGTKALAGLVARLEAVARAPFPLDVRVADGEQVNAFAAPGGYVVILRGLIDQAESGDEVAGVLAHEIGHVVERHASRGLIRRIGILFVLRGLMGGDSTLSDMAPVLATWLLEVSYSRRDESAADAVAVELLSRAGLSPDGLVAFFERLAGRHEIDGVFRYLSTHPAAGERGAAIKALSSGAGAPALSPAEFAALRRICD